MTADEPLLFGLDRARDQFAWKTAGLDAEALHRAHPPSTMTLGGLIKHLALVEERYTIDFTGEPPGPPLAEADWNDPDWAWRTAAGDPPEQLYAWWRAAVEKSRAAMAKADLDQPPQFTQDVPSLRHIVVDLHEEYARHVGHADLFREAVDGLVGQDPPPGVS